MKLSTLIKSNFEAGEFFRGCQNLPNYPDLPAGTITAISKNGKSINVICSDLLPFEESCLNQEKTIGKKIYDVLNELEFFYIVVIGENGIDAAYVPEEIFKDSSSAELYAAQHQDELLKAA
jgi:hypothetical protein